MAERRLIDATALVEKLKSYAGMFTDELGFAVSLQNVIYGVEGEPTVDAVEVVHGRWIFGTANHREYMKCSVCLKSQTPTGVFTYCPNCGAKMDGERKDNG